MTRLIDSRGTLSPDLKELSEEGLVQRRVATTKPMPAFCSLIDKDKEIAALLNGIKKMLLR